MRTVLLKPMVINPVLGFLIPLRILNCHVTICLWITCCSAVLPSRKDVFPKASQNATCGCNLVPLPATTNHFVIFVAAYTYVKASSQITLYPLSHLNKPLILVLGTCSDPSTSTALFSNFSIFPLKMREQNWMQYSKFGLPSIK